MSRLSRRPTSAGLRLPWSAAALILTAVSACGTAGERDAGGAAPTRADSVQGAAAVRRLTRAQLVRTDPCARLARADVERILGPLAAVPVRVVGAERPDPSPDGNGCLYQPTPQQGKEPYALAVEVIVDGALTLETGLGATLPVAGEGFAARTSPGGVRAEGRWDWTGGISGIYAARQGHIAVMIGDQAPWLGRGRLDSLAGELVDRIPDIPFADAASDPEIAGSAPDPCALLTASEAEEALGPLLTAPYRSRESSPLVHGNGSSCTYYTAGHHVVVITPTWSDAATAFKMLTGATHFVGRALSNETAADTLEGPWDQASSGMDGTLYFLRGERMLAVQYGLSSAGAAAAITIARIAAGRL